MSSLAVLIGIPAWIGLSVLLARVQDWAERGHR